MIRGHFAVQIQSEGGGTMRHIQIFMLMLTGFAGCSDLGNPVSPVSDGVVSGPFLFTLIVPSSSIPANDTLRAIVQVYNKADTSETLTVGSSQFSWSLKTQSGRTEMWGPKVANWVLTYLLLNSHQTKQIYAIRQAIVDSSGLPVAPGTYVLEGAFRNTSTMTLSLALK